VNGKSQNIKRELMTEKPKENNSENTLERTQQCYLTNSTNFPTILIDFTIDEDNPTILQILQTSVQQSFDEDDLVHKRRRKN
jgi:hypothetical protein